MGNALALPSSMQPPAPPANLVTGSNVPPVPAQPAAQPVAQSSQPVQTPTEKAFAQAFSESQAGRPASVNSKSSDVWANAFNDSIAGRPPMAAPAPPAQPDQDDLAPDSGIQQGQFLKEAAKGAGSEALGMVSGLFSSNPAVQAALDLWDIPSEYRDYEAARAQGKSPGEAAGIAAQTVQRKNDAIGALKDRVKEFSTNPGRATGKAIMDLIPVIVGGNLGGEEAAPEAADADASAIPTETDFNAPSKPTIFQKLIQGEKVAQPEAQYAMRKGAAASTADAGVADQVPALAHNAGIRTFMDEPIAAVDSTENAAYAAINKAAGTDLKTLYDHAADVQDALDDPTNIANRVSLKTDLQTTQEQIQAGESQAAQNGVASDALDKAKAMTQQRYAMETVKQKLFNNESVVKGNAAHGAPEEINVDAAIREAEKLDKPSKFAPEGSPTRLQQAFGGRGAKDFKQSLYDAQKTGKSAVTARWIAGIAGGLVLERNHVAKILGLAAVAE